MTCEPIRSAHYMGTVGAYSSGICIHCTSEVLQSCTVEILVLGTQSNLTIGKSKTFIFSSDFLCLLFSGNMPLHVISQLKVTLIIFWSSPASIEVHAGSWNRRNQGYSLPKRTSDEVDTRIRDQRCRCWDPEKRRRYLIGISGVIEDRRGGVAADLAKLDEPPCWLTWG